MVPGNGKKSTPTGTDILTTRQGHPVHDNQSMRTVGNRGPATLENYQFLEKMSHFDRERVPSVWSMHAALVLMDILKPTGRQEMNLSQNISEQRSFRKKASKRLCLSGFQP